jgi:hypothetical protein
MHVAGRDRMVAPARANLVEHLRRIALNGEVAVMQTPFRHCDPVQVGMEHRLRLVHNSDPTARVARMVPVVLEGAHLVGFDLSQGGFAGVELAGVVELRRLPSRDARVELRPDGSRQRLERVAEPRDHAALGKAGERRQLPFGRPALEERGFRSVQTDDEHPRRHVQPA